LQLKRLPNVTAKNNKRAVNRRASQNKYSGNNGQRGQNISTEVFGPIHKFSRVTETGFDIYTDGVNPTLQGFRFMLSQLPSTADFTNLYDVYRISKVDIEWTPEYTELTDAALVSNAVNVRVNSCIDLIDYTAPSAVDTVLQYSSLKSTSVTKEHKRSFKPCCLVDNMPCTSWQPSSNPSEPYYGIKIGIQPSGVAMTFRGRVRLHLECASVN